MKRRRKRRKGADADKSYFAIDSPPDYLQCTQATLSIPRLFRGDGGRRAETLEAVRNSRERFLTRCSSRCPASTGPGRGYAATVRFGLWEDMIAKPAPIRSCLRCGRVSLRQRQALASKGRIDEAKTHACSVARLAAACRRTPAGSNRAKMCSRWPPRWYRRASQSAGHHPMRPFLSCVRPLRRRHPRVDEPKDWFFPVRQVLGAELMAAGRAPMRKRLPKDLEQNPANGWSLFGLQRRYARRTKRMPRPRSSANPCGVEDADVDVDGVRE